MTDPLFTPAYPLSLDAAGLLEGTHITTRTTARKTDQYREAITMNSVWRIAAVHRFLTFVLGDAALPASELFIDATLLWFKGNRESIVFAHPYADVKRLWGEYLLRQRSAP